jgi:PAS domain S-box-containing protein
VVKLSSWFGANGISGVQVLWEDGGLAFCTGWRDSSEGRRDGVLLLTPPSEQPTPASLERLTHEYSLKDELDSTWAARPLELLRDRGRTVLVLENPAGELLSGLVNTPMDIERFLRLAIGVAAALGKVHQHGFIHKDIKPAHILVDPAIEGEVRLTGFGMASRLPRERQPPYPLEVIAGTLAYMAPEQTGRMNRSVDSRSDLYSLGVTFYEMLTGGLPFAASDPMEWIHCHIARTPAPPHERVPSIPRPISHIVAKLLAKTAEERYQTAAGVERDLQRCLAEWQANGRIEAFPPGEIDAPDRLSIPEKLYGRAREIDTLVAAFDRVVTDGNPEVVLVSGYSGIGKSAVVNELHKVLVSSRGLFASGKVDQYKRNIPYATIAQAFQSLIRPLLAKTEADLRDWRRALGEALGLNGLLIVNLVPELQLIIGEQPPLLALPLQDAQALFHLVCRRFVGVFARREHPLVLFLDDLQWMDLATLDLLEDLLRQSDLRYLMFVGAYRDNEVNSSHPLIRKLEAIRQAGAMFSEIILAPLTCEDLGTLAADTLHCSSERVAPLAQLIHGKTGGSPFFAIQFISALVDESLLTFDHTMGRWSWELNRIQAKSFTDNVVDLMVGKLNRLQIKTQETLKELACLGNNAAISTLSLVHAASEELVHLDLAEALRLEFIVRLGSSYKFAHDRIQEAAYSLIPERLRAEVHLRIGRLLMGCTPTEKQEEAIFEIVNQLNRGATLIASQDERDRVAELNLVAAKRARTAAAYASSLEYLIAGATLMVGDRWERRHDLAFALEFRRAECEFLTGELAAAETRLNNLAYRARTTAERATVESLRIDLYTVLDQTDRVVIACLDYLRHLGIDWSPHPTEEEARYEYERIWFQLGIRTIEELIELPLMSDTTTLATLDVLTKLFPTAMFVDLNLMCMSVCRAINISLEHGNSDASCVAYVYFGKIAGPRFGDYKAGLKFGQLGYELVEKPGLERFRARTYLWLAQYVLPWTSHVKDCRNLMRRAFEAATQIGDLNLAVYSLDNLNTNFIAAGDPLVEAQRQAENGLEFARTARFGHQIDVHATQLGLIKTLRGLTFKFGWLDDHEYSEAIVEQHFTPNPAVYWIRKLQARFFAGDYASALDAAATAGQKLWTLDAFFETAEYHFYAALSHAACCSTAGSGRESRPAIDVPECSRLREPQHHIEALASHHRQLEIWAVNSPKNFDNRVALVGAEIARIEGRDLDAMRLYERAILSAREQGFVHNEALAHEVASRFYSARGFETSADAYLRNARHAYLRWGADGKVQQLDQLYPHLAGLDGLRSTWAIGSPIQHLDVASVVKASQALSGEILLPKLIKELMTIALESAGADRGLLILAAGDEHSIQAEARAIGDQIEVTLRDEPITSIACPESVVRYVIRTKESVILDDASKLNLFSTDNYLRDRRSKSILCLPLIKQRALAGILLLENGLTSGAFTPARLAVLEILAAQAAISLENTRLYSDLQEREAKVRRLVDSNIIGIVIIDLRGRIIEANDAFLSMVGYEREDVVADRMRWTELTPPEWRAGDAKRIDEVRLTGTLQPFEKEYFRKDGNRVPVLVGVARIEEGGNQAVAFVVDLTERKRAESDLAHANRVATMGQLAASIAHEVSQPIAATLLNAESAVRWLSRRPPDLEKAKGAIDRIINDGKRASDILSRIRDFSKKEPARYGELEVNEAILEVMGLTRAALLEHGVLPRLQMAERLPSIFGDRVQFQQVVLNLMMNAIEAMSEVEEGSRALLVSTSELDSDSVLVSVGDSGPGLPPTSLARIFEAFYTTKASGLGMGLSICRSIVESHGGRLWAAPNEPRGAVFCMTLPIGKKINDVDLFEAELSAPPENR